jgi:hypothetical protein
MSSKSTVLRETIVRDADNLAVWLHLDANAAGASQAEKLSLINAEIQAICNEFISTLDDSLHKKSPRPTPTPRIFIEQGSELSQLLWLRWEP